MGEIECKQLFFSEEFFIKVDSCVFHEILGHIFSPREFDLWLNHDGDAEEVFLASSYAYFWI